MEGQAAPGARYLRLSCGVARSVFAIFKGCDFSRVRVRLAGQNVRGWRYCYRRRQSQRDAQEVIRVPAPASTDHDSRAVGLAWSHELDLAQLLAAVGATQLGEAGDEDAAAEEAAAADAAAEAGMP